jgi:hypothetical protein
VGGIGAGASLREGSILQIDDRGAPAAGVRRGVGKAGDERRAGQDGADDLALDPEAPAVDDPKGPITQPVSFSEVSFQNGFDLARRDGVEVKHIGNRNGKRFPARLIHGIMVPASSD